MIEESEIFHQNADKKVDKVMANAMCKMMNVDGSCSVMPEGENFEGPVVIGGHNLPSPG